MILLAKVFGEWCRFFGHGGDVEGRGWVSSRCDEGLAGVFEFGFEALGRRSGCGLEDGLGDFEGGFKMLFSLDVGYFLSSSFILI